MRFFFRNVENLFLQRKGLAKQVAIDLLDYSRFDVTAKTLLLKFIENDINSNFAEELYKHHLNVWNGFKERYPVKNSFEEYLESFIKIKNDIKSGNFAFRKSPIELDNSRFIFNGSHRLASAIFFGKDVITKKRFDVAISAYNYEFFSKREDHVKGGLKVEYMDAMAMEYVRLKEDDLYITTIFPAADETLDEKAEQILKKYCDIVYKKEVFVEKSKARNFIKQIYHGEPWATEKTPESIDFKTSSVFNKDGNVRVYLIENKENFDLIKCKDEIRGLYNAGKHSIHINDTYEETLRIAGLFFNENSIRFAKASEDNSSFDIFNNLFAELSNFLSRSKFDSEFICLDSSTTLAVFGLRDVRDLDFLHSKYENIKTHNNLISSHNAHDEFYTLHRDDIVMNPRNHFYYLGLKVATPDVIASMKSNRNEEKDRKDLELLSRILY